MRRFQLFSLPYQSLPSLVCLGVVSFVWGMGIQHSPQLLQASIAPFTMILSASFLVLSQIRTYQEDKTSGVLLFLVGNQIGNQSSLLAYALRKVCSAFIMFVLPLTFLGITFFFCFRENFNVIENILFATSLLITTTTTLVFTHFLSALTVNASVPSLFSLFLIWPFLIPTLILSLSTLQESNMAPFDTICLNLALCMLTFGVVALLMQRLLTSAFDAD